MSTPFRFALQLLGAPDARAWTDRVRWAEDTGYSTVSMQDHVASHFSPLPALAAAAAVTSVVRLATFVLANGFRHPALVAKDAATLQVLSDGRFELGLGAGWLGHEFDQLGIPFESAGGRIARLGESVEIIRRLFAGGPVTYTGEHYSVRDLELVPATDGATRPRLILAGGGPRILTLAGQKADIVSVLTNQRHRSGPGQGLLGATGSLDAVRASIAAVRDAAGERITTVELNLRMMVVDVTDRPAARAEEIGESMGMSGDAVLSSPFALVGTVDSIVERLHWLRDELGVTYFTVDGACGEMLAPVVARVAA